MRNSNLNSVSTKNQHEVSIKRDRSVAVMILDNSFQSIFEHILNYHAPLKKKTIRANQKPHMSQNLRKAIMKRSHLKNIANKTKSQNDFMQYKKQRNYVVKLNKQEKKIFFHSVDPKGLKPKTFWQACKPLFTSNTPMGTERLLLVQDNEIISNDFDIATIFNNYFNNITSKLAIKNWDKLGRSEDPILNAIEKYSEHSSIIKIKSIFQTGDTFAFENISSKNVLNTILQLDKSKKTSGNIPIKILQLAATNICDILTSCINSNIANCEFPYELKRADIIPCHKKDDTTNKINYRPISLLPTVSKVYEKILYAQINAFFAKKISNYLCGFRKGYNTQYSLLNMLIKWQKCLDNSGVVGAILMDLSNAFDCLSHELLIAKLEAYGFGIESLKLIYSYLKHRPHRVRVESTYSAWLELLLGVPQGSILGPLLFNIFINDLLLFTGENDLCNFADDNTSYFCGENIETVASKIEENLPTIIRWFKNNFFVVNPDKFQVIFLGTQNRTNLCVSINGNEIKSTNQVKLLGITIDDKLNFLPHIRETCKKVNRNSRALIRLRRYLSIEKTHLLCNAYILSNFNYCPLIWSFCSREGNNMINKSHKLVLNIIHSNLQRNRKQSLDELISIENCTTIHIKNLQQLMIEIYKCIHKLNPKFMWELFPSRDLSYQLRTGSTKLIIPPIKTKSYGINSFIFI